MTETESRIQILDRLSVKWGQRTNPLVENFDDFCLFFDSKVILDLVYMAMSEYQRQWTTMLKEKKREEMTDEKIEEMMIETMKGKWAHCWIEDKLVQRPANFEEELKNKVEGAKLMLLNTCFLKADIPPFDFEAHIANQKK